MKRTVTLLVALALSIATSTAFGATVHVPGDSATIQAGINGVVNGDTVLVANGTYTGDGNRDIDFGGKNIVLKSENGPGVTIIDCEGSSINPHRAVYFHNSEDSTAVVDGFTIINGYAQYGGGINVSYCSPVIKNCYFVNNTASGHGGGVHVGGNCSPYLMGCLIRQNIAHGSGGGMFCIAGADAILINCIITKDSAYEGGAITCIQSSPTLKHCILVGNKDRTNANIYLLNPSFPVFENTIIAYNHGFSIACDFHPDWPPSDPTLMCCDVYGNTGGDWVGCLADQADSNGNFSLDPFFCDTANGDYHIGGPSPCLPAYSSCGVLIGALGVGCATEPIAVIDPDTMYVFQAHTIDTILAVIYFGDFTDGHTVADIDPATILVNGGINPTSWTLLPSHPDFYGEAMEITFPIRDFILGYMTLWDTTIQEYSVSGQFNDNTEFVVSDEVTMIGHTSGDVNGDGRVNIVDLTYLIAFLFNGGAEPPVLETADVDHSGAVNVADVTELVRFLFG